ncbi:hypothetical protein PoB_002581600 [Plakobranchus ocellatus]|uniref:Uncharacterized protein n=1 Tax=Plakobranchus ocellatus TaxID=259542 RepID=A0AAV3ZXN3_9GAST|nr:hypothetical protein PoB_002581600 [Plakobranchus ocellatus]
MLWVFTLPRTHVRLSYSQQKLIAFDTLKKCASLNPPPLYTRGVGGTVASESALKSAWILQSRVRAPPPALWPDGGHESLRSPCYGQAIYKKPNQASTHTHTNTQHDHHHPSPTLMKKIRK